MDTRFRDDPAIQNGPRVARPEAVLGSSLCSPEVSSNKMEKPKHRATFSTVSAETPGHYTASLPGAKRRTMYERTVSPYEPFDNLRKEDVGLVDGQKKPARQRPYLYLAVSLTLVLISSVVVVFTSHTSNLADFYACFLLELVLSADNCFVAYLIFQYYKIPPEMQMRCLYYGLLVAIPARVVFIAILASAANIWWLLLIVSFWLIYKAFETVFLDDDEDNIGDSWIIQKLESWGFCTASVEADKFFTKVGGNRKGTRLLLALLSVEMLDLIFAFDSVAAIIGVTRDIFVLFTSNIGALITLRSVYVLVIEKVQDYPEAKYVAAVMLTWVAVNIWFDVFDDLPDTSERQSITITVLCLIISSSAVCIYRRFCKPEIGEEAETEASASSSVPVEDNNI